MWEKRKLNKILAYSFLLLILFILQSSILSWANVFNQSIDLVFAFVIAVAMFEGIEFGSVFGFVSGVFVDIFSKTIGFHALFYMIFGFVVALITIYVIRCNFKTFITILPCSVFFSRLSAIFLIFNVGKRQHKIFFA